MTRFRLTIDMVLAKVWCLFVATYKYIPVMINKLDRNAMRYLASVTMFCLDIDFHVNIDKSINSIGLSGIDE